MKRLHTGIALAWLVLTGFAHELIAADGTETELVSRVQQSRLFDVDVRDRARDLITRTRGQADAGAYIAAFDAVARDPALDAAGRDAVLLNYVNALRDQPPGTLPQPALKWLIDHEPAAVRHHEEGRSATTALFNVSAAARGLRNQWIRQEAGALLVAGDIATAVARYTDATDANVQAGIHAAIPRLPPEELERLQSHIENRPELGDDYLSGLIHLYQGKIRNLSEWLIRTDAGNASRMLSNLGGRLSPDEALSVLEAAAGHEDAGVRAHALATGSRLAASDPEYRDAWLDLLTGRLADPRDGTAAALQLARIAPAGYLEQLENEKDDGPAVLQQRLELIRQLRRSLPTASGEVTP